MNGTLLIAGGNIGATEQGKADIFGRFSALCGGKPSQLMKTNCSLLSKRSSRIWKKPDSDKTI